jgi:hypothetical protein
MAIAISKSHKQRDSLIDESTPAGVFFSAVAHETKFFSP